MFIRSERLFLRPGWPEDWFEIRSQIADKDVARSLESVPSASAPNSAPAFAAQSQDPRCPHFLITMPTSLEPARVIGGIGLTETGDGPELGFWIARDFWGLGFATEAISAVLRLARTLGHREVRAGSYLANPASARVLRKVGFCPTGEVRKRFCATLGEEVVSAVHAITLGKPSNCDDDNFMADMRAA
ncbi:MAG: GNAT family N-acetyltransferase [Novosphingobium sp.]